VDVTACCSAGQAPLTEALEPWYHLLHCRVRAPLVGGSGKDSNAALLGSTRTYARLAADQSLSYRSSIDAVRAGRTFVTNGPLLFLTVNGRDPGAVLDLAPSKQTVRVRAEAHSIVPFDRLEVLVGETVIARAEASGSPASAVVEGEVVFADGGNWILAQCWGRSDSHRRQQLAAITSPVYVQVAGAWHLPLPATTKALCHSLEETLAWVNAEARFENEQQRGRLEHIIKSAKDVLLGRYPV